MNNRRTQLLLVLLLVVATWGLAGLVVHDRRAEPDRVHGTLVAFIEALEAGDVPAAAAVANIPPRDPEAYMALQSYLEVQAGAAQLNRVVVERFGDPLPQVEWPLPEQVDPARLTRMDARTYVYLHEGQHASIRLVEGAWMLDFMGIESAGMQPVPGALGRRMALEQLADRVRAGAFTSPAEVRRAMDPHYRRAIDSDPHTDVPIPQRD